jgi:anaerobic selenocysteine-containing dehydrogenase
VPLLRRREFLLASSAAAGAVLFAGCVPPQRELEAESRVLQAEDVLSAYDNWYATTCRGCEAGCGVVVRVVDGRARKVEGNPDHPVNRGKLCARGQALVQEQYHPDRIRGPLRRDPSARGGASFEPVAWDVGLDALVARLRDIAAQGRAGDVSLITPPLGGHRAFLVDRFARAYGLKWLPFEPVGEAPLREAARRVFGAADLPRFDIQNARTVLSFGADFLGSWLSPVRFGLEYGVFRQGSYDVRAFRPRAPGQARGRLIHVDTRFSTTAASADEWVWVRPGAEGVLAVSIAEALGAPGLAGFAAESTAARTGVAAERVRRIARELTDAAPSLVIGGGSAGTYTHGTEVLTAILGLNTRLGNVGRPGGVLPAPPSPVADLPPRSPSRPLADWQDLVARMQDGREQAVLFVGGANPVYGLPAALGFPDALRHVPFVASFGSFPDESTLLADLVLPSSLPLEDWGDDVPDPGVGAAVLSVQQPVVQALFDTRGVWDVLLTLADELGDPLRQALPWPTFKDLLRDQLAGLAQAGRGSVQARNPEQFWGQLLQHGGWWDDNAGPPTAGAASQTPTPVATLPEPRFAGDPAGYPFVLVPFRHNTLGAGEAAHLPWLQAAPDPITSVTWQTWAELNPRVAADLGVVEGDVVAVASEYGRVDVPVYVSPAAPPEVLAMPLGQGHSGFGRWARQRGANPLQLLAPLSDAATGALAYGSTRVAVSKTGRRVALPKLEGEAPARQLPDQEVVEVARE